MAYDEKLAQRIRQIASNRQSVTEKMHAKGMVFVSPEGCASD